MSKVIYLDRDGVRIDAAVYKQHLADPSYVIVREYDNGQVQARLKWTGRIENPGSTFADYYKLFVLEIKNYTGDGQLVPDPVDNGRTFASQQAAIAFYEAFLARWTKSNVDEFGEFVEADNALTPPPPPNPDKPASEPDAPELGGVGAW